MCIGLLAALILPATSASAATSNCFPSPSACGYPDATNTGVPAGTTLTASGSRTVSTNGTVLSGLDITGTVTVTADNVTIEKSRITKTSGGSGSYAVILNDGADNFTIRDTEVVGPVSNTSGLQSAVWNHYNNPGALATRVYFHRCADCWEGAGTFRDAYMVVDAAYTGSHDEAIYVCGTTVDVDHSTLINTHQQTATVFGDTICGGNDFTVTNSLLAGGGFLVYPQANSSSETGTTNISGNRFARCLTTSVYNPGSGGRACSGGADSAGYYPFGGYYGVSAYTYSGPDHIWENNVWDDNSQAICEGGSPGCGTSSPPPPPVDTPASAVWTAPTGAEVGVPVSLSGSGSRGDTPITCTWSFEDQAGAVLDTRTGCKISYTFEETGTQYVKLTVQDGDGDTNSNRKSFTVAAAGEEPPSTDNPAAAVWTPPSEAEVGVPITLDGTESEGDGTLVCTWSFEDESGRIIWETHEGCELDFTFQMTGSKYVKLTVEDSDGDVSSSRNSFSVTESGEEPPPPPPDTPASAVWSAPADARAGTPVTLDGTGSGGDDPLTCTWTFEDESGSTVLDTQSGCEISYTFPQAGPQYITLIVQDDDGDSDSNRGSFLVAAAETPPPPPPDVAASAVWNAPTDAKVGTPVTLDGSGSGGDGPLTCTWTFEDESGSILLDARSGCKVSYTFQEAGAQYVKLTVQDDDGDSDASRKSFSVTAAPTPPPVEPPEGEPPANPAPVQAIWSVPANTRPGQRVTLDGTASKGDAPLSCVWTVEDRSGTRVWQRKVGCRFSYRMPWWGTQYVRLTVTDSHGSSDDLRRAISGGGQARSRGTQTRSALTLGIRLSQLRWVELFGW